MNIAKKVLGFMGALALMSSVSAQTLTHKGTQGAPGGMDIQILMAIDSAFQFDVSQSGLINAVPAEGAISTADIDLGSYDYISGCATASANHSGFLDIACGDESLGTAAAAVKVVMDFDSTVSGLSNGKVLDVVWDVSLFSLIRGAAEQASGIASAELSHYIEIASSGLTTSPSAVQGSDTLSLAYDNDSVSAINDDAESFQVALKAPLAGPDAVESIVGLLEGAFTVNNL